MIGIRKGIVAAIAGLVLAPSAFAACPNGTDDLGLVDGKISCGLKGKYLSQELVLSSDKNWVLEGGVFIGDDNKSNATIRIQPGTRIIGQSGADFLVITRGSKIFAEGTKQQPIVFTTAKKAHRNRGEWGGLIINGNAPINSCKPGQSAVCEAEGEGSTGLYGGNDSLDSSGVLKYVVVEFAGYEITPENELNGISFQGVGAGTDVDYVQVHMNADDGIEFFGGTVNVKHVILTGNKDDSMDWTSGWQGKAQFILVQQFDDAGNNGIEADNLKSPMNAEPRSNPTISNITLLGTSAAAASGGDGMLLRVGTGASIHNAIITGFKKSCLDIDDEETFRNGANGSGSNIAATGLRLDHTILFCPTSKDVETIEMDKSGNPIAEPWSILDWFKAQDGNMMINPLLDGYMPKENSPAAFNGEAPLDLFFDFADYIGAFEPGGDDWTAGWTTKALH